MVESFDVAVVGGGSAGCVLAARLSEDPARRVLLLEAGPDHGGVDALPDELRSAQAPTFAHDWGFRSESSKRLPRAKVLGGCSATNAMVAVRGAPGDYDGWAEVGCTGWSWDDVLPYFRRLERDLDFQDDWHGTDGPLPIRRYRYDELSPVHRAAMAAAEALGHSPISDHNAPGAIGGGAAPTNADNGIRVSTAIAYLWPVTDRPNLVVRCDQLVDRVVVDGGRAAGVRLADGTSVGADVVILAAGAYGSPAILLRSGIGPAGDLHALGVEVVVDLPGVGADLQDHPMIPLVWQTSTDLVGGPVFQTFVTLAPDDAGSPQLQLLPGSATLDPRDPTTATFFVSAAIVRPHSRGTVSLRSTDPATPPRIEIGHLDAEQDLALMARAVDEVRRLAEAPEMAAICTSAELTGVPATFDPAFAAAARSLVTTYHHAAGTCAIGSVVDHRGAVLGVDGLFVADASVMPTIPSANTNVPTIMIAEKVSDGLQTPHA